MKSGKTKRMLIVLLACVWCLPLAITLVTLRFQLSTGSEQVPVGLLNPPLEGLSATQKRPALSLAGWFSGDFQQAAETWFTESFGLRGWFIRLNNQVDYSVFRVSRQLNDTIAIGDERQLYEVSYLRDACRLIEPAPAEQLEELIRRIARVQKLYERHGVRFVFVITPQKGAIYPEFMPRQFQRAGGTQVRDYEAALPLLRKYGVKYLDGHELTLAAKSKYQWPLFCQGSSHWNDLGVFDTASAAIPLMFPDGQPVPRMEMGPVDVSFRADGIDADLAALLNVLSPPRHYPVPHPQIRSIGGAAGNARPALVIIGGSFTDKLYRAWGASNLFRRVDWYRYYIDGLWRYPAESGRKFDKSRLPWKRAFLDTDILVLEVNESNFRGGHAPKFLEDALHYFEQESRASSNLPPKFLDAVAALYEHDVGHAEE